jgi:hypothetical protein
LILTGEILTIAGVPRHGVTVHFIILIIHLSATTLTFLITVTMAATITTTMAAIMVIVPFILTILHITADTGEADIIPVV